MQPVTPKRPFLRICTLRRTLPTGGTPTRDKSCNADCHPLPEQGTQCPDRSDADRDQQAHSARRVRKQRDNELQAEQDPQYSDTEPEEPAAEEERAKTPEYVSARSGGWYELTKHG